MMLLPAVASAVLLIAAVEGARILAVIPFNGRSHFVVMEPLLLELQARGHEVTVLSSFPQSRQLQNYRDIDLSDVLPSAVNNYSVAAIQEKMSNPFRTAIFITEIHLHVCDKLLSDRRVQAMLEERFDLVIGEVFGADCFNYLTHLLRAPLLSFVTSSAVPWLAERTGLPDHPAYIPNYFLHYNPAMSLSQRVYSTITLVYSKVVYHYWSSLPSQELAEKAFGELPPMDEVNKRTSLVFVNSHYSLAQSRPFPPNVVEVGGIHIRDVQPLPQDLSSVLSASSSGVVLFSLGSLVRASSLPPAVLRMFLDVFSALPLTVIVKYEDELPDTPPNVIVRRWLPQTDIVAHPNVRAVITHCGLASTIEAVYFAKPVVALPFYADQFQNANNLARRGAAVVLDYNRLSHRDISRALKAVLEDPSYSENMRRLSAQFRDRPMTALQTAVYWTEYVIRHQGAPHLRPASVHLPLYQYLLIDVAAVIFTTVAILVLSVYTIVKYLLSKIIAQMSERKMRSKKLR